MPPIYAELIRQALRWLGVWLMTAGVLPPLLADMVADSSTSEFVIGLVSYAIAEGWWGLAKVRAARATPEEPRL